MKLLPFKRLGILLLLSMGSQVFAQIRDTLYKPIEIHLQARSQFLWRGLEISNSPNALATVNFRDKTGNFKIGARGSTGFNGDYKQVDYFVSYQLKNIRLVVFDIFNNSKYLAPNTDLFDYNAETTRHFIDATIGYTISKEFPLDIAWSTIIAGRDRGILPGDVSVDGKDPLRRGKNRYSTYVQLTYPVQLNDIKLDFFTGAAFALNGQQENFYGNRAGIATLGVTAGKTLHIGKFPIPIYASPTWNPLRKTGGVVLGVNLF